MMDAIAQQPLDAWARYAGMLADLHDALHAIPAPDWLRQLPGERRPAPAPGPAPAERDHGGARARWSSTGPTRRAGDGLTDVGAHLRAADLPEDARAAGSLQLAAQPVRLLAGPGVRPALPRAALDARIAIAAELKALDKNLDPDEVASCRRLADRMRRRAAS